MNLVNLLLLCLGEDLLDEECQACGATACTSVCVGPALQVEVGDIAANIGNWEDQAIKQCSHFT